jgi:hypothetical protein
VEVKSNRNKKLWGKVRLAATMVAEPHRMQRLEAAKSFELEKKKSTRESFDYDDQMVTATMNSGNSNTKGNASTNNITSDSSQQQQQQQQQQGQGWGRCANSGCKFELVLDPLNSTWIVRNNQIQILALVYTALFTPFEVALLPPTFWGPKDILLVRWWLNRIIDLLFLMDMMITCLTPFKTNDGYMWERSNRKIIENYLRGWFFPDFLALFPW